MENYDIRGYVQLEDNSIGEAPCRRRRVWVVCCGILSTGILAVWCHFTPGSLSPLPVAHESPVQLANINSRSVGTVQRGAVENQALSVKDMIRNLRTGKIQDTPQSTKEAPFLRQNLNNQGLRVPRARVAGIDDSVKRGRRFNIMKSSPPTRTLDFEDRYIKSSKGRRKRVSQVETEAQKIMQGLEELLDAGFSEQELVEKALPLAIQKLNGNLPLPIEKLSLDEKKPFEQVPESDRLDEDAWDPLSDARKY